MALGGGNFTTQNKLFPGTYVNYVSMARAGANMAGRGAVAVPKSMDWGSFNTKGITKDEFMKNSLTMFGYEYTHENMTWLREIFRNAKTVYVYRLGDTASYASCSLGTAQHGGTRGNDLKVVVTQESGKFTVKTLLDEIAVDEQTVTAMEDLKDNNFVTWKRNATLAVTAGIDFTGGVNPNVTNNNYMNFLNASEHWPINVIGISTIDSSVSRTAVEYIKNARDNLGVKRQCVLYNCRGNHEGVINVFNPVMGPEMAGLVYWVMGLLAGCEVNKSCQNKIYDGEYPIFADYSQSDCEINMKHNGSFMLHRVGEDLRVFADINSLVDTTAEKGDEFKENQTVRVIDQISTDIAALFNEKYLGSVPNDEAGRISLWADIVKHHEELARIRAIENFSEEDVEVLPGDNKKSVVVRDKINVVNAMAQVYMTCVIA